MGGKIGEERGSHGFSIEPLLQDIERLHASIAQNQKFAVEREYGLTPGYYGRSLEIDHIVPLELGGSNAIANLFPDRYHHGGAGHPWKDHRPLVNGILWHLHTGAPWPDTPQRYGP